MNCEHLGCGERATQVISYSGNLGDFRLACKEHVTNFTDFRPEAAVTMMPLGLPGMDLVKLIDQRAWNVMVNFDPNAGPGTVEEEDAA